jgi:hypothetical protein
MRGTRLRIWIVRVVAISGVTFLSFIGWSRFQPHFTLPDEVKNTPFEEPLRQQLTALTGSRGWLRTGASVRNLSKHSAVGDRRGGTDRCGSVCATGSASVSRLWLHRPDVNVLGNSGTGSASAFNDAPPELRTSQTTSDPVESTVADQDRSLRSGRIGHSTISIGRLFHRGAV